MTDNPIFDPDIECVDSDCNIYYKDGRIEECPHRPRATFEDCDIGYGPGRGCKKWDMNHLMGRRI